MKPGIDVYLSHDEVATEDDSGAMWRYAGPSLEAQLDALVERLRQTAPRARVRVWLSGAFCRAVLVPPVVGARSRAERRQLAEMLASKDSGLTSPCRVAISPGSGAAAAAVAVVVAEDVLATLQRRLGEARIRAVSIRPWFDQALAVALRANEGLQAFAVWEGRALTILMGDAHGFSVARTIYPVEAVEAATAAVARAQVSALVAPDGAQAIRLDWTPRARDAANPSRWAAVAFASCVLPLGSGS